MATAPRWAAALCPQPVVGMVLAGPQVFDPHGARGLARVLLCDPVRTMRRPLKTEKPTLLRRSAGNIPSDHAPSVFSNTHAFFQEQQVATSQERTAEERAGFAMRIR